MRTRSLNYLYWRMGVCPEHGPLIWRKIDGFMEVFSAGYNWKTGMCEAVVIYEGEELFCDWRWSEEQENNLATVA